MNKNKNFSLNLQCIILICVLFSACNSKIYNTIYRPTDAKKFYSTREPCEVVMVMKLEEKQRNQLELIGTCTSKKPAGGMTGKVNNAMKEIRKCACINGGDLLLITNTQEKSGTVGVGGLSDLYNPNATKVIYSDKIEALVYRKKR